ncbi:MAG: ATP-binding protein [Peptococcaceae bacterium]|nr:ATP-binding protein [Peptococcaceae bacterium]
MEDLKKTIETIMARDRTVGASEDPFRDDVCPHCSGRGFVVGPDDVAVRCSCMDIQHIKNQMKSARLSRELAKCRLDDFDFSYYRDKSEKKRPDQEKGSPKEGEHVLNARKAWQAARDFVDGVVKDPHHIGLMYSGQAGSGKTYLAAAIANELIRLDKSVLFVVVPDLLDEMRATFDRKDVSEFDLLDMAKTVPILVFDDLGAHNYTDWTVNRIYSILNYRVNEQLPLIVTTNLHHGDIACHLGERTSSRLLQMCRSFKLSTPQDIRWQQYTAREKK